MVDKKVQQIYKRIPKYFCPSLLYQRYSEYTGKQEDSILNSFFYFLLHPPALPPLKNRLCRPKLEIVFQHTRMTITIRTDMQKAYEIVRMYSLPRKN